ncbi:hypothetical protein PILCRDRAFT_15066 [Piloderma croceum F 1598]|uniref:Uncharacterized protein n=1 Tax=Piloderma croceum (strain F 1598) TaxID=765440 RepID=A0A0C3F137_PILCF|nr:hypothetical protein PILCRDRAFT_15066 [Piloderma croceum F 1598]
MIGFADTEHNSEQKIPNCAPHFAQCALPPPPPSQPPAFPPPFIRFSVVVQPPLL